MLPNNSMATHVIFDIGQTVVDIIRNYDYVLHNYARGKGKKWNGSCTPEMSTLTGIFQDFLIDINEDTYKYQDKFKDFMKQINKEAMDIDFKMMPGALKLITHLHEHNIPMAFATNGEYKFIEEVLKKTVDLDMTQVSHVICGADDPEVKNNKPAPDIYSVCAKRFKTPLKSMSSYVIFEDSIRGITGAVTTGMKTVLINNTDLHKINDITDKITVIVDSLENFRPEFVGLPPYE